MADYRVMGIMKRGAQAQHAVEQLQQADFASDCIAVLYLSAHELAAASDQQDVAAGAAAGTAAGGVLGALAGLAAFAIPGIGPAVGAGILGSAMAGSAAGGVLGAWSQIGLSDDLAASYQEALEQGDTIFAVETPNPDRAAEAEAVLRNCEFSLVNTFQV